MQQQARCAFMLLQTPLHPLCCQDFKKISKFCYVSNESDPFLKLLFDKLFIRRRMNSLKCVSRARRWDLSPLRTRFIQCGLQ